MIHPTAIISPKAELGRNVRVGPYCVIGSGVVLGDDCVLHSHVILETNSVFGKGNEFFPFAVVGGKTQDLKYIGEPTALEVGDHNVFRENCTIHRGTHEELPTRIGSHNLFLCYSHVAHDCQLGDHIILSNNGSLAGHCTVGDYAIVSGLAAAHQFCRIGKHSIVGGLSNWPVVLFSMKSSSTRSSLKARIKTGEPLSSFFSASSVSMDLGASSFVSSFALALPLQEGKKTSEIASRNKKIFMMFRQPLRAAHEILSAYLVTPR